LTGAPKPVEGQRRLFRKGESLSTQAQLGMFGYDDYLIASGFQSAAQILAASLKEGGPHPHLLVYPLVFAYRQFVELMLKHIVRSMQSFATFPNNIKVDAAMSAHAIEPLIELIAGGMEAVDPQLAQSEEMRVLKGRISEFHEMDPGSYAFRYTRDKRGKRYNEPNTTFDLASFAAEMEEVAALLYDLSEWSVESNATVLEAWAGAVDRALRKKREVDVLSGGRKLYSMVHGPTAEWSLNGDSRWATAHLLGDKLVHVELWDKADVESFHVERFTPAADDAGVIALATETIWTYLKRAD